MASCKGISIVLLIVVVALAGGLPVFAQPDGAVISFTPAAACPGATVTFTLSALTDIVGGGISVAAMSPLGNIPVVLSSNPDGLTTDTASCVSEDFGASFSRSCTFVVSESASCGHYTVTIGENIGGQFNTVLGSGTFDVAGSCCAVGGCVQPVNTFGILSPWLAVIGLVGCIGTVVVVAKKRHP
ncbi:MAG: hypothetical protein ABSA81_01710 [Candidatus Bathyarchaeia archaeon]